MSRTDPLALHAIREDGLRAGSPLAIGTGSVRGVCRCGPLPIPFRCG